MLAAGSPLSLYYQHALTDVGRVVEANLGVVDARWIERFHVAIGMPLPRRCSSDDAMVAPANFLAAIHHWGAGPGEDELALDGVVLPAAAAVRGLRSMGAGEEMTFIEPVRSGTEVVLRSVLETVVPKSGRSGPSVFETRLNEFRAGDGRLLNSNRKTIVRRNPHGWEER